jgi:hypothetical protein
MLYQDKSGNSVFYNLQSFECHLFSSFFAK